MRTPQISFAIRLVRQARGWSQRDLGNRRGTDRAHISRFETEPIFRMKPTTVVRLADALEILAYVLIQIAEARLMKREVFGPWPSIVGVRKYALPQGNTFCKTTTLGPGVAKRTKTLSL